MRSTYLIGAAALAACSFGAYPNLGPDVLFPQIGMVTTGTSLGSGTIITPNHVLTARHVGGMQFRTSVNGVNTSQTFNATSRINHPTADLAILEFAPNTFTSWIRPDYDTHFGEITTMVGFGLTAVRRGDQSGWNNSGGAGIRRSARNVIDGVIFGDSIFYDIDDESDPNNNHFSGGTAITNEGGIISGDSGGAWLINGKLVGVNAFVFDTGGNADPNVINTFLDDGDGGGAVGVDFYEQWIETNAPIPEPASMAVLGAGVVWLAALRRRKRA